MKDILLVKPIKLNKAIQGYPPIGLGFLSAYLKKKGYTVEIIDCNIKNLSPSRFSQSVKLSQFHAIGFQLFSSDVEKVKQYLNYIKKNNANIKTIIGGPQVASDPVGTLNYIKNSDYGVYGEGETCIEKLLLALKNGHTNNPDIIKNIPNLAWKHHDSYQINPKLFEADLDEIEGPDWDAINPNYYGTCVHGFFSKKLPTCPILVTRGCPFQCKFCGSRGITGYKVRSRGSINVVNEIEYLKSRYGVKQFQIIDDNFTANKEKVIQFCEALINRNIDMPWNCPNGVRLDTLNVEMLKIMKNSGCYEISVGIESGNQYILDSMKKNLTLKIIREKINMINMHGIDLVGFFMVGYPSETEKTIEDSRKLALELPLKRISITRFAPFPGTPIAEDLIREGKIDSRKLDYSKLSYMSWTYIPDDLSKINLKWLYLKFFITFYLRPHILLHNIKGIHSVRHLKLIFRKILNFIFGI